MGMVATEQLTEFLSAVAERQDEPTAHRAAVECAARALGADVGLLIVDGQVVAATGDGDLDALPAVARAPIGDPARGSLIVGKRAGAFTDEETCLLRGMAQVIELSLHTLHLMAVERRQAQTLHERRRLFEHLTRVQRLIARRAPLQETFDAITSAAAELLDVDVAALGLLEHDDPTTGSLVSAVGLPPGLADRLKRIPVAAAGVCGLAVEGDELVMVEDYIASPIAIPAVAATSLTAAMAVPVHENGTVVGSLAVATYAGPHAWDQQSQEVLSAFAEHVSLALTDAQTLAAMNQAFHDSLTGLASRALFLTRMERAFEELPDTGTGGVGLLFVDLDRFKVVNDSLGHPVGDLLLQSVAARIQACLRSGDTAARLGGDEFAVLIPYATGVGEAEPVARRILEALRKPYDLGGREAFVSSSIGVAFAGKRLKPQDLMVQADLAMYQAKKLGKDRFELFRPELQQAFEAGMQMETDLRRAIVRHEFELRYQPIVHLRTGEITGLEALVRWQHPERGLVPPLDFIPLAEETGMIVPIGEWVLREACRAAATWNARRRGARPLSVSVNLSAVQLEQPHLPAVVQSALNNSGLAATNLVLELTESLLVDHRDQTLRQLETIKSLGVRLAIDDFGTGYSSLAYLRRFPVDIIKIDKSFVDDVGDVPAAAALTHGIIQLGQALSLSTVAEGIEDKGQLAELTDGNCELGQGYYFAEPLSEQAMSNLLFPGEAAA
jgi:diguanylate cyclase (GGDEF)-like protein